MPTDGTENAETISVDMLLKRLGEALPMVRIVVDLLADELDELRRDLLPVSSKPIGELLLSPATNLSVLQTIKDHGKQLARRPGSSESERDAALAIYFAAIASALVCHDQKISSHAFEALAKSFTALAGKPWITVELAELYRRAEALCRQEVNR